MMNGTNHQGAKKLVIRPFAVQPKLPENLFELKWTELRTAVVAIYDKNGSTLSKEELYRAVEDLCVHKYSQRLYDDLVTELRVHVSRQFVALFSLQATDNADFLIALDNVWTDHCATLGTVRNVFLYLDRSYALHSSNKSIWDVGLMLCRSALNSPDLQLKIVSALLFAVQADRSASVCFLTFAKLVT
jgi:cullin 4